MKWIHFIFICHWHIFCVENILQFQYCFWLFTDIDYFFMCKMFSSFSTDVYGIFCYWNILMKCTHFIFICHLLMLTYFLCGKYSTISILLLIIYWCWLFFHVQNVLIILNWCLCDFLLLKHIDEVITFHLHLSFTDVDIFFVWKIFYNFNTAFDNLLMLTIFYVQNVLIILNWFLCDFLVLKHIDEVDTLHLHLSLTYFLCGKYSTISILLLIIYWCWLFFHVQNVLIILNWCLCDFLLLKHINEVHTFHLLLSFTDVDIFFVWKIFYNFNTAFDYLLMLTIFSCAKCSYHSQLMFVWFSVTETYWWSAHISSSFVIYWCWHIFCVENILWFQYCFWKYSTISILLLIMKWILHLHLSLTYFLCGKYSTISILLLIIYWCWHFFMCKMFLSFSTDVYVIFCYWNILMKCTHFIFICHLLMLTYFLCGKYSTISILLLIIYWCWQFFMYKMFLPFSTDVYVIFSYWNILMKWIHFIFICHWHIFCVENILQFQYCFWLFTDVDYFFMCKMFLSFSTDVYVIFCYWNILMKCTYFIFICHLLMLTYFLCGKYSTISILLLIIYWCWLFFHVQNVLIILNWCLCDFLLLKHIDEVHTFHLHLSFTDVDIFFVWKIFYNFNTAFDYLLMLTNFSCTKCSYHSQLMFMWFSVTETYWWSARTSSSFVIYWCWHIFCVENILQFQYCFW